MDTIQSYTDTSDDDTGPESGTLQIAPTTPGSDSAPNFPDFRSNVSNENDAHAFTIGVEYLEQDYGSGSTASGDASDGLRVEGEVEDLPLAHLAIAPCTDTPGSELHQVPMPPSDADELAPTSTVGSGQAIHSDDPLASILGIIGDFKTPTGASAGAGTEGSCTRITTKVVGTSLRFFASKLTKKSEPAAERSLRPCPLRSLTSSKSH